MKLLFTNDYLYFYCTFTSLSTVNTSTLCCLAKSQLTTMLRYYVVGGTFGLWVGWTTLTMFEFIILLSDVVALKVKIERATSDLPGEMWNREKEYSYIHRLSEKYEITKVHLYIFWVGFFCCIFSTMLLLVFILLFYFYIISCNKTTQDF